MDEQFTTYGTPSHENNITPEQAAALEPKIKETGVQSVDYDETTARIIITSALYSITFAYSEDDEAWWSSTIPKNARLTPGLTAWSALA